MSERRIMLTDNQFDRMMAAVRFYESMQRGSVRGQDVPEPIPAPVTGEVWVKVTGPKDEAFKPEDTETDYYPCVLTEKFVLSDYEELTHGPLASYWKDYDAGTADEQEARCFALNNGALTEGQRYKATVVDQQDNQFAVLGISDSGAGVEAEEQDCLVTLTVGSEDYIVPSTSEDCELSLSLDECSVVLKRGEVTIGSVDITACIDARLQELCRSKQVVTNVECEEDELTPTFFTLDYVTCPTGGD